jgi:hypothetical protein
MAIRAVLDELRKSFKISFLADLRTTNVEITDFTILLTTEDDFLPGAHRVKQKVHVN